MALTPRGAVYSLVKETVSACSLQGAYSCESKSMCPGKSGGEGGRRARTEGRKCMVSLGSKNQWSLAGEKEPGSRNCFRASLWSRLSTDSWIPQKPHSPHASVQLSASWDLAASPNWQPSPRPPETCLRTRTVSLLVLGRSAQRVYIKVHQSTFAGVLYFPWPCKWHIVGLPFRWWGKQSLTEPSLWKESTQKCGEACREPLGPCLHPPRPPLRVPLRWAGHHLCLCGEDCAPWAFGRLALPSSCLTVIPDLILHLLTEPGLWRGGGRLAIPPSWSTRATSVLLQN